MKITIPLSFKRKKEKAYCKKCHWKKGEWECVVKEQVNDYNSKKHSVTTKRFGDLEKQNKNNDCEFYCHNYLWWLI